MLGKRPEGFLRKKQGLSTQVLEWFFLMLAIYEARVSEIQKTRSGRMLAFAPLAVER
jgi:hypothetical protein